MWLRNREIHDRARWNRWHRMGCWIFLDRGSIRSIRDEDMPWELKPARREWLTH